MFTRILLSITAAAMLAYGPFAANIAEAKTDATSPIERGSPIWAALEATKKFPATYIGPHAFDQMEGSVLVRFHVGSDGHPQNVDILRGAHFAALDAQTKESIEQAYCLECAGQDYTVTYHYQPE
jgi:TonB family protein